MSDTRFNWNPEALYQCRCKECPLGPNGFLRDKAQPWSPVPGQFNPEGAKALAVGQIPADEETANGYPFAGKSGTKWEELLGRLGLKRPEIDIDNVCSCQPPGDAGGAWERMQAQIKAENEQLEADGYDFRWPDPAECCKPRLDFMAARYTNLIALGGTAAKALAGVTKGITGAGRGPRQVGDHKVMCTLHPAFVLRASQWEEVLEADLAKAFRWFEGRRNWAEPHYTLRPSPAELRAWLRYPARFVVHDYETSFEDPLEAEVHCIGLATLVEPAVTMTCEKCAGTGRRWQTFDPAVGWRPALPEERGLECTCCAGKGERAVMARGVVIPLRSREDPQLRFYTEAEEAEIKAILAEHMTDPTVWKVGHNASNFDRLVTEQWLRVTPRPLLDTLALARARAPDLPKGLGVVGSILTDVHAWKADADGQKLAESQNDAQLWYYNLLDCCVNAQITDPLIRIATERGYFRPLRADLRPASWPADVPWTLAGVDMYRQEMACHMHYNGMYVDHEARKRHETKLTEEIRKWRAFCVEHATALGLKGPIKRKKDGPEPFNPGSDKQVAQLLFKTWGLIAVAKSEKTGKPSTADEVLRNLLTDGSLEHAEQCERDPKTKKVTKCCTACRWGFVDALRRYRRAKKAKATFVMAYRRRNPDRSERIRARMHKGGKKVDEDLRFGETWEDDRVRPSISAIMVAVGRLNIKQPAEQQQPSEYRDILTAAPIFPRRDRRYPGRVQIGGDIDQFHLRIIANYWRIGRLLEAFHSGIDPHSSLAWDFFGDKFKNADGWGPDGFTLKKKPKKGSLADKMRNMAKVIRYQGAYADVPEGIWRSVVKVEDKKTGDLPFADVTLREVKRLYRIWMRAEPEWERAWEVAMNRYRANGGWIEEPIFGRRSGSLENGKKQAVVNFEILACEPSIMSIIEHRIREAFPIGHNGPGTGLVNQTHDSANVETEGFAWVERRGDKIITIGDAATERKRKTLEEAMNIRIPGWEIPITSEAQIGPVRTIAWWDKMQAANNDDWTEYKLSNWKEA